MRTVSQIILSLILAAALSQCGSIGVFEKNIAIPGHAWSSRLKPEIKVDITDTGSLYNIYVVLRHTDAYDFKNIWLNIGITPPGDSTHFSRWDLPLATDEAGWLGDGMDDIYEHRILLTDEPVKLKTGEYRFTLEHLMREDPLQHVLNAGIRVEKTQP